MEDFDKYVLTDNHIPQNINEYYNNYIKEDKTPNDPFWEIVFHTIYNKMNILIKGGGFKAMYMAFKLLENKCNVVIHSKNWGGIYNY